MKTNYFYVMVVTEVTTCIALNPKWTQYPKEIGIATNVRTKLTGNVIALFVVKSLSRTSFYVNTVLVLTMPIA